MEQAEYRIMYEVEDTHWWYVGMRAISDALLQSAGVFPGQNIPILDAGCGTGYNLEALARYGSVTGIDLSPDALAFCSLRHLPRTVQGSVTALPFAAASFGLVTSFDVLYHKAVPDDELALREFVRVLKPEGLVLLRLPAHGWLFSQHDRNVHTRHRYTLGEVQDKLKRAGLNIERATYVNGLLFPLALAKRLGERIVKPAAGSNLEMPSATANRVMGAALVSEARWLRRFNLPAGLSAVCLARKCS